MKWERHKKEEKNHQTFTYASVKYIEKKRQMNKIMYIH